MDYVSRIARCIILASGLSSQLERPDMVVLHAGEARIDLPAIDQGQLTFLLCIEGTGIEPLALLLCESIRRFAGRYSGAAIVAVSPRPEVPIRPDSRARLAELGVRHIAAPLNRTGSTYLPINRIVAGAWAERELDTDFIVALDSDMLFAAEPDFPAGDAGVRPVDMKGACSTGSDDPQDAYWQRICDFAGIAIEQLPMLSTTVDNIRVRASYNGGFAVVRRSRGILQKTEAVFSASFGANLRPQRDSGLNVHASTGRVGLEGSEFWGSSQAALSAAISARAREIVLYDARYNIPMHLVGTHWMPTWPVERPILLHYHWLMGAEYQPSLQARIDGLGVSDDFRAWISERLAGGDGG